MNTGAGGGEGCVGGVSASRKAPDSCPGPRTAWPQRRFSRA